jgi:AraC-like DNA-binding protein
LSDLLKKNTGKTAQEHIHAQLMDKAKLLLWSSEKPVSEIAYDLGFAHPSHFNKIFKNRSGMSPKEFRLQQINNCVVLSPAPYGNRCVSHLAENSNPCRISQIQQLAGVRV